MREELVGLKSQVLRPNLLASFPCPENICQTAGKKKKVGLSRERKQRERSRLLTAKRTKCLDEAEWYFLGQGMFRGSLGGTHGVWADVTTQSLFQDCSSCHVFFFLLFFFVVVIRLF